MEATGILRKFTILRLIAVYICTAFYLVNGQEGPIRPIKQFEGRVPPETKLFDRLVQSLLSHYDIRSRPYRNIQDNVTVQLRIELLHLTELDETRGIMTVEAWIGQSWKDVHLTWEPEQHDNIDIIRVPIKDIWKPDISIYNRQGSSFETIGEALAIVEHTGTVYWTPPATIRSTCDLNYANYPRDIQLCTVVFGSWAYDGMEMDIVLSEYTYDIFSNSNPKWNLIKMSSARNTTFYPGNDPGYDKVFVFITYNFKFARRDGGGDLSGLAPRLCSCVLIMLMFCTPGQWNKVFLGCTAIILQAAAIFLVVMTVPVYAALPYALSGIHILMILSMLAIALEVLLSLLRKTAHFGPPLWILNILGKPSVQAICCLWGYQKKDRVNDEEEGIQMLPCPTPLVEEWSLVAVFLEKLALIIFPLLLFAFKAIP